MTDIKSSDGASMDAEDTRSAEEIQQDLAETREDLEETLDALGQKLDVKTRSRDWAEHVRKDRSTELAVAAGALAVAVLTLIAIRRKRN